MTEKTIAKNNVKETKTAENKAVKSKEEKVSKIKKTAEELGLTSAEEEIYNLLGFEPVSTEYITANTNLSTSDIQGALTALEIYGIIEKIQGYGFVIK